MVGKKALRALPFQNVATRNFGCVVLFKEVHFYINTDLFFKQASSETTQSLEITESLLLTSLFLTLLTPPFRGGLKGS